MERIHNAGIMENVRSKPVTKGQETRFYKIIDSPVGPLTIVATSQALLSLTWGELRGGAATESGNHIILQDVETQLKEYFAGTRKVFDIPLAPSGTEFQQQVWQELQKIPFGSYISYGEQARRLNRPKAARAVGAANGKNPIGIIIPCHRVLGATGHLTGFAGGIEIKRQLLELEGNSF